MPLIEMKTFTGRADFLFTGWEDDNFGFAPKAMKDRCIEHMCRDLSLDSRR